MAKIMKSIFGIALLMTVGCCVIYRVKSDNIFFILAVTFGTTAYHFGMRLLVGTVFDCIMKNRADYTKRWYHVNDLEMKLYKKLNVKKWKKRVPTYDKDLFDISKHSGMKSCRQHVNQSWFMK